MKAVRLYSGKRRTADIRVVPTSSCASCSSSEELDVDMAVIRVVKVGMSMRP